MMKEVRWNLMPVKRDEKRVTFEFHRNWTELKRERNKAIFQVEKDSLVA
jgi:hypothetical protein